jgi:hypothetical protein
MKSRPFTVPVYAANKTGVLRAEVETVARRLEHRLRLVVTDLAAREADKDSQRSDADILPGADAAPADRPPRH